MIVSSIVPAFAISEAPAAPDPDENTVNLWIEDAEIDYANGVTTLDLYVQVDSNEEGFEYLSGFIVYPECLTLTRTRAVSPWASGDLQAGADSSTISKGLRDACDTLGIDVEDVFVEGAGYKYTHPVIDAEREDEETGDPADCFDEGRILRLTFSYDHSLNTIGAELPITWIADPDNCMHCFEGEWAEMPVEVVYHGATVTIIAPDECDHNYPLNQVNVVEPTCGADGSYDEQCSNCGEIVSTGNVIPATGEHTFGDWTEKVAPTYSAAGEEERVCSVCGATETRAIDPIECDHADTTTAEEIIKESTCTVAGSKRVTVTCNVCGEVLSTEVVELPLAAHTKSAVAKITKVPTAAAAGTLSYRCAVCDKVQSEWDEVLPAIDPAFEIAVADSAAEPSATVTADISITNTNYGADGMRYLVYWDEALTVTAARATDVFTADDQFSFVVVNEARAKADLAQEDIDFDTAGYKFAILVVDIPDEEWQPREGDGAIATLTITAPAEEGEYEYGILNIDPPTVKYHTYDEEAEQAWLAGFIDYEIPAKVAATLTVEAAECEHDYVEEITIPATCTEPGVKTFTCSKCGDTYTEEIPAPGHVAGEAVEENRVEASCTEAGSYDLVVYCTVCGAEISREAQVIEAPGHVAGEAVEENRVEASCTEAGSYDLVVYCTVCGAELSREPQVIEAPGHVAGEAVEENRVEASCAEAGSYDLVVYCTVCGAELSREPQVIEKLPHTPAAEYVVEKEATPEEDGYEVLYCTVCGEELDRRDIHYTTLDVELVLCSTLASGEIDNAARTINVTTKLDAAKAVFELRLKGATFTMSDEAFAAGNKMQIKGVVYEAKTDAAGIRYMMSYATNGYEQSYTLEITYEGETYVYDVNVTFDHSPACSGVVPCYNSNAELTGFDPEDDHLIRVVAVEGANYVTYRLDKVAKGASISVDRAVDTPHTYQTLDGGATFKEVEEITDGLFVYFRTEKSDEAREYDITITYANGDAETYHVIVNFPVDYEG
jgi:hypothetical protein